ncbi:MAG: hypothetical protein ABIJ21_05110 [Nanoarchaeota archaeon]
MNKTLEKIVGAALFAVPIAANIGIGIYRGCHGQGIIPAEDPAATIGAGFAVAGLMSTVGGIFVVEKEYPGRAFTDSLAVLHVSLPSIWRDPGDRIRHRTSSNKNGIKVNKNDTNRHRKKDRV